MKNFAKNIYMQSLRCIFGKIGHSSWVSPFGQYFYKSRIHLGDNVYIGEGAHLSASEGIFIGNGVTIGPALMVIGGDHKFDVVGSNIHEAKMGGVNERIIVEDDVWIGARVTLLKNARIGEGAIIGAGAVVTRYVPPYTIYAGNPARMIGTRFTKMQLEAHLKTVGSKYSIEQLQEIYE